MSPSSMATQSQIDAVARVLSDPGNAGRTSDEVAELILSALEKIRARQYKYVVIGQLAEVVTLSNGRRYFPTWVRGPFYTAAEAHAAATRERRELTAAGYAVHNLVGAATVMGAQCFGPEDEVNQNSLREILL